MSVASRQTRILSNLSPERAAYLVQLRASIRESGLPGDLDARLDMVIDDLIDDVARLRAKLSTPRATRLIPLSSRPHGQAG